MVTVIWQFTNIWNDFLFGASFSDVDSTPMTVALNNLVSSSTGVKEYNVHFAGAILAARAQKTLDDRVPIMWRALSNLSLIGTRWGDARLWRWTPGIAGHAWFLNSNWQQRADELYSLAAEVTQKATPN